MLNRLAKVDFRIAERAREEELLAVHDAEYIEAIKNEDRTDDQIAQFGLYGDNPPFPDMYDVSRGYVGVVAAAAKDVRDGAPLAFGIGGGLHHAQRDRASGFCIFNDASVAINILQEKFKRVAYVDIDLHHGDGVQAIWLNDPTVLTYSIHESGRTLYPGTGSVHETSTANTSINCPLVANTASAVWLGAFRRTCLPALEKFQPQAIVLQTGTDSHFADPLGHLNVMAQDWLAAIKDIKALGLPMVVTGGGGYNLQTVPRMWVASILTLSDIDFENRIPEDLADAWDMPYFFDLGHPGPVDFGQSEAQEVIAEVGRIPVPLP